MPQIGSVLAHCQATCSAQEHQKGYSCVKAESHDSFGVTNSVNRLDGYALPVTLVGRVWPHEVTSLIEAFCREQTGDGTPFGRHSRSPQFASFLSNTRLCQQPQAITLKSPETIVRSEGGPRPSVAWAAQRQRLVRVDLTVTPSSSWKTSTRQAWPVQQP